VKLLTVVAVVKSRALCVCVCVCVCGSHCVSTLSPAGSGAGTLVADMPVAHVEGLIGGSSYLPAGEGCYQCDELEGFDRLSVGVPLARRTQRRRRRDTLRAAASQPTPLVRLLVCLSVCHNQVILSSITSTVTALHIYWCYLCRLFKNFSVTVETGFMY